MLGATLGRILTGIVIGEIEDRILDPVRRQGATVPAIEPSVVDHVAAKVEERIADDPVLRNELNQEPLVQSRVAVGSSMSLIAAVAILLGVVFPDLPARLGVPDWLTLLTAGVTVWGAGYALYGRVRGGLKPLFSRFLG